VKHRETITYISNWQAGHLEIDQAQYTPRLTVENPIILDQIVLMSRIYARGCGGTGRRRGLKILRVNTLVGSIPTGPTISIYGIAPWF
jgi:hypothetical protein